MNNYDKIKQMSVDEMAKWLDVVVGNGDCIATCIFDKCTECDLSQTPCIIYIRQWLLSESEE